MKKNRLFHVIHIAITTVALLICLFVLQYILSYGSFKDVDFENISVIYEQGEQEIIFFRKQ